MSTGFCRSRLAQRVVPLATSLGVHAGIIIAGVLAFKTMVALSTLASEPQLVTPDIAVLSTDLPAAFDSVSLGDSFRPNEPALQDVVDSVDPALTGFNSHEGRDAEPSASDATHDNSDGAPNLIGIEQFRPAGGGKGPGSAQGADSLARFGPRQSSGVPSGSIFAGKDRSVVFVCDASGSMLDKFDPLRRQIGREVKHLQPIQSFNVIFFRDERCTALNEASLLQGFASQKERATQFLDEMVPSGATNPLPAIDLALRQKPELIWLLTDGDFPDNTAVLEFLRKRNPGGRVRINTIAFVDRGDGYENVLQTIAAENRGEFRYVSERELE